MVSKRGNLMPASSIRKLIPYADEAKKRGIGVYHLNIGQPDVETPYEIFSAIRGYKGPVLKYGPSQGIELLRVAISDYFKEYNINVEPEEILVTTGGSEAILFSMLVLCDPEDEIIVPEPFYANYNGLAHISGVKLIPVSTLPENGFHLPHRSEFIDKISKRTRAILVCSPNNPTGTVYTREEMEMVANIAKERNLFVLSDEVYREFVFEGGRAVSILDIGGMEERAIIVDSISKRFSACGARIGFIACKNRDVYKNLLKFAQARLCPPTIEEYGAIAGFKSRKRFIQEMILTYKKRRDVAYEEILKLPGVFVKKPKGAFYAMIKLPVTDAEKFIIWLLRDFNVDGKTVMLAPGNGFYATPGLGRDEARIAFILKEDKMRDAIKILGEGLERYKKSS